MRSGHRGGRRLGPARERAPESVRSDLFAVQRGICPGCGLYLPHYLRFEVDHIVALAEGGTPEQRNLQLLCGYCNRVKGTKGKGRVPAEAGRAAGGQRGHRGDGGREASGSDGKSAGRVSPWGAAGITGWLLRPAAALGVMSGTFFARDQVVL